MLNSEKLPATGNPVYNQVPGWRPGGWRQMPEIIHGDTEIKGFFGEYRWLSNFGKAHIFLDGEEYSNVELAYQAAKWNLADRSIFGKMTVEEAINYNRTHSLNLYTPEQWDDCKLDIMRFFIHQKFSPELNPENHQKLIATGDKYLEETNWWGDTFWGVTLDGRGENQLGKLLMEVRRQLK